MGTATFLPIKLLGEQLNIKVKLGAILQFLLLLSSPPAHTEIKRSKVKQRNHLKQLIHIGLKQRIVDDPGIVSHGSKADNLLDK